MIGLALGLGLAGCDRPEVLVICHNANCADPADPESDDTLPALRESLALEVNGRPAIDGIEVDSFLRGSDGQCLFAHDLKNAPTTLMSEVPPVIAEHFARPGPISASSEPYRIFLELKDTVDIDESVSHTPEQRALHVACAWSVYTALVDAARTNNREIEIIFSSFEPKLLRDLVAAEPSPLPSPYRLDAFYGIPKPLNSQSRPLDDYTGLPIGIIEIHAQWIHDAQAEGVLSQNVELMLWMFSATVETFAAIEQYQPKMVGTSEARLMRRWLER